MPLRNSQDTYGSVARWLHWSIAILVITLLIVGHIMTGLQPPLKYFVYAIHKSTGITILLLVILRIVWRLINPRPTLPTNIPRWQRIAANGSHLLLYLLILAMPLSGWIMSTAGNHDTVIWWLVKFNTPGIPVDKALSELAGTIHVTLSWCIVALVSIHILAALKHHFINKDNVLKRMLHK